MSWRLVLPILALLAVNGCASSGAVPRPFPLPAPPSAVVAAPAEPVVPAPAAIVNTALSFRGVPYRTGGSDPSGFDCSGFVQYVFAQHGIDVPREVRLQYGVGRKVSTRDIAPGDLIFFKTSGSDVSHVGIAIGGDEFVHAPTVRGSVRTERLSSSYWDRRYAGARRISS